MLYYEQLRLLAVILYAALLIPYIYVGVSPWYHEKSLEKSTAGEEDVVVIADLHPSEKNGGDTWKIAVCLAVFTEWLRYMAVSTVALSLIHI